MANCPKTQYVIGLDFGSLSCRGVIAGVRDGGIVAEASAAYPHGCMDSRLPDGTPLADGWRLRRPGDFVQSLKSVVSRLLSSSGLDPRRIVGIGVDFTASTVIPVDADFVPLCERDAFAGRPHAWAKMWKHHSAVGQAARLTQICRERAPGYLDWYGGTISPESLLPKVLQVFDEDPLTFDAAHAFVEAADYITSLLAGRPAFSAALASAKAFYSTDSGYPDADFFAAYDPALRNLPKTKLMERYPDRIVCRPGERAGGLSAGMARALGLPAGIAVAAGHMDGYAPVPGLGIARPGAMVMVVGTSTAIMALSEERASSGRGDRLPAGYLLPGAVGLRLGAGQRRRCVSMVCGGVRLRAQRRGSAGGGQAPAAVSLRSGRRLRSRARRGSWRWTG